MCVCVSVARGNPLQPCGASVPNVLVEPNRLKDKHQINMAANGRVGPRGTFSSKNIFSLSVYSVYTGVFFKKVPIHMVD